MKSHVNFIAPFPLLVTHKNRHHQHPFRSYVFACTTNAPSNPTATTDANISPSKSSTTGTLPPTLIGTTVVYNIPSQPPHIPTPLAHQFDGDGYILAISFQSTSTPWIRGRFIRTKPFMTEAKASKRIYRGRYGTTGASGWNAPLKAKAASASGAFIWGNGKKRRVFAWGIRSLPFALDVATLVSKGTTAMGATFTDSPELASGRATEIVAQPVRDGDSLFVVGVGRTQNGRVLGAFVTEIDRDYKMKRRLPRVDVPPKCEVLDFAVGERVCVLLLQRVKEGSGGGMLRTLLERKQQNRSAPQIDVDFGSVIVVVPRDGGKAISLRLEKEVVASIVSVDDRLEGVVSMSMVVVKGYSENIPSSTIRDIQSGCVGGGNLFKYGNVRVELRNLSVGHRRTDRGEPGKILDEKLSVCEITNNNLSLLCPSKPLPRPNDQGSRTIFNTFDHSSGRCGIAVRNTSSVGATFEGSWLAEEGYNVGRPLVLNDDQDHVCAWVTAHNSTKGAARLMIFNVNSMENGPLHVVELDEEKFGVLWGSVGGSWVREAVDWSEEGNKPVKSAYEIFDSRQWNDIDSGFSSLGLGQ